MLDARRRRRIIAALSGGVLAAVLVAPVALAQTDEVPPSEDLEPGEQPPPPPPPEQEQPESEPEQPGSWGDSSFEAPFDEPDATLRRETFDIEGTLRYQKTGPSDAIDEVEVRVVDDPSDSFTPPSDCTMPPPAVFAGNGPQPGITAEHAFAVLDVTIPCNGRYLVEAQGWLEDPDAGSFTLRQSFVVAARPASVTGLGVTLDGTAREVTATFQPLVDDARTADAIGYVLERSGPEGDTFVDVATIGVDDPPSFVDPLTDAAAGAYTYRVRAVRGGADGEIRSSIIDAESDTIEVEGEPSSSSTSRPRSTAVRTGGSRSSAGRTPLSRSGSSARLTTPTTRDTGFDDTLDYGEGGGDGGDSDEPGDDPLAGASIVRDEQSGMGLAVPAAGALVMLGWAGHILYLNRLAKQL